MTLTTYSRISINYTTFLYRTVLSVKTNSAKKLTQCIINDLLGFPPLLGEEFKTSKQKPPPFSVRFSYY